jgi:hypothetical protein
MRGCGRAVSGAFCSFLFRVPDAKEVRYLGLRLATLPWLNIRRRFAARTFVARRSFVPDEERELAVVNQWAVAAVRPYEFGRVRRVRHKGSTGTPGRAPPSRSEPLATS